MAVLGGRVMCPYNVQFIQELLNNLGVYLKWDYSILVVVALVRQLALGGRCDCHYVSPNLSLYLVSLYRALF